MPRDRRIFRSAAKIPVIIAIILLCVVTSTAHPGRTDAQGGHHVSGTGEYHYHHGHPAHQHPNGVCPYRTDTQKADTPKTTTTAETEKSGPKINGVYIFIATELTSAVILFGAYKVFALLSKKTKLVVSPMLIKPKYAPGDSTAPMAFYKIQRFFLPFSMLYFAFRGFSDVIDLIHIAQDNSFSAYSVFVLIYASVYYLGTIALWAFALNGLARMEWSGPRCMFWACFWSAGQTIVQYALGWFTSEQAGSSLSGALILLGIVYVYYSKRRNLFTPLPVQQTPKPAPAQPSVKAPQPISPPSEPVSPPAPPTPEAAGEQMVLPEFAPSAQEPPKKKRFSLKLLSVLLAVVCVASLTGNVAQYFAQKQLSQQSNTSQQTINGLKQKVAQYDQLNADQVKTINQLKIELAATQNYADVNADAEYILSEYVRFVYSDNYYHTYNCTEYPFMSSNDTFWAHNLEYCQYLGFKPCPYCS